MPLLFCLSFQKKYLPDDHISNGLNNIHKHTTAQPTATRWKYGGYYYYTHFGKKNVRTFSKC